MHNPAVIVLDFETTGMSPAYGDRPIEVGAVRIEHDRIVDRFQELMNPGFTISWFIESLTGISNELVAASPPCEEVMTRFAKWIDDTPLVAHNAGFDRKFLDAELALVGRERTNPMACTVLAARRLYPESPNHKLATLVSHLGHFHRRHLPPRPGRCRNDRPSVDRHDRPAPQPLQPQRDSLCPDAGSDPDRPEEGGSLSPGLYRTAIRAPVPNGGGMEPVKEASLPTIRKQIIELLTADTLWRARTFPGTASERKGDLRPPQTHRAQPQGRG